MRNKQLQHIEDIGWRFATEQSMLRRMNCHDYQSRCIYMLTLTLRNRAHPILGKLLWDDTEQPSCPAHDTGPVRRSSAAAVFIPSPLGLKVKQEWEALCDEHPQLSIIKVQLMPEHLHVVLFVKERIPKHLGKYVGILKNRCNKHYWRQLEASGMLASSDSPPSLFSENFQDTILTHEGQLDTMVDYVEQNPYRALVKRDNPEFFTVITQLEVAGHTYAAIGNRWLLDRPVRMQVRCHNNESPHNIQLIARQKDYFLHRGSQGGVVVSHCISSGEKEIAHAALDAKQPLIVVLENGFPPHYKPQGKYFTACAEGLLLMLAPWPYHTDKHPITRSQCNALNEMAKDISNEPWTREMEQALSQYIHLA